MGTKSKDWAWEKLGMAKTSDKEAIHAAYADKRAKLDAEAARISAFAELTEAREKALFFASELQREAERSAQVPLCDDGGDDEEVPAPVLAAKPSLLEVPELPKEAPAEPEYSREGLWSRDEGHWTLSDNSAHSEPLLPPENTQELDAQWEHGGGYQPSYDVAEDDDYPAVEPGLDPDPDEEWSHSGAYVPESEAKIDLDLLIPEPTDRQKISDLDLKLRGAVRGFLERYPIKNYWVVYGIVLFFLVRSCS